MNLRLLLARKLTRLARWMPSRLRDRFGGEIEEVWEQQLEDAAAQGWLSFLAVVLRELIQFPGIHLRQRFSRSAALEGGIAMSGRFDTLLADTHEPTPWGWALVALIPFLFSWIFRSFTELMILAGINIASDETGYMAVISYLFLLLVALLSAILVIAWTRGFPTWSYSLGFMFFVFSLYASNVSIPGLTLFGYEFGRRVLHAFALIPLGVVVGLSLLLTIKNPARPFLKGFNDLAQDFSRASFGLFGLTPLLLRVIFDEVHGEEVFLMFIDLLLAGCALIYLRARRTVVGVGAMVASQILIYFVSSIYLGLYWNGRQEEWMPAPANGWQNFIGSLTCVVPALLFTLGPWLVHLYNLRRRT